MNKVGRQPLRYIIGSFFRACGQGLDKAGSKIQSDYAHKENLNVSRRLMPFSDYKPLVKGEDTFIAPNASLIGNVELGEHSSLWYNGVARGDVNAIVIGKNTHIQDRVVLHGSSREDAELPVIVGDNVTIEAGAIIHACTIKDNVFIGIGTTVLDGVVIESKSIVGAGSVVAPSTKIASGELWAGVPAKKVRDLTPEEQETIEQSANKLNALAKEHKKSTEKTFEEVHRDMEAWAIRHSSISDMIYTRSK
mmetsp:Transcript_988/g.1543  ORF Transcript_988/g.1543 Transcript_988/m.1543 type:complete len:250 (+) Transcript_988:41-790(+)